MRKPGVDAVLTRFGLEPYGDQLELLLAAVQTDDAKAERSELALATLGVLMMKSGIATSAVIHALKTLHGFGILRESSSHAFIAVSDGEFVTVVGNRKEASFKLADLQPFEPTMTRSSTFLTTTIFNASNLYCLVCAVT